MSDIKVTVSGADIIQRKIKAMGRAARPAMRKATYGVAREMVKTFKAAAKNAGFKKSTGATMRSIGIKRLKDGQMKIGVRYDYQDKRVMKATGKQKIPNMYAAKVNEGNPWFTRAWDATKDTWAHKTINAVNTALKQAR
jgi:hypothetical protein